jgi:3-oxoacyl-[acyl-carrier-protein] synthase II
MRGKSGIRALTPADVLEGEEGLSQMPITIAGCVPRVGGGGGGVFPGGESVAGAFDVARWCEGDVGTGSSGAEGFVGGGARIAPFAGLALAAAEEALDDAGWAGAAATEEQKRRAGVSIGAGMGRTFIWRPSVKLLVQYPNRVSCCAVN